MLKIYTLLPLVMVLAVVWPESGAALFACAERWLKWFAASNRRAVATAGLLSLSVNIALTLVLGVPVPKVNDEFSHLLLADTLAHGRLTNPPHPLWVHFESCHIIQQPTYASKYPVGQGLALALGQVTCGHPIVGVWVSTAAACAALCWMLLAFVPRPWALLGGVLAAFHPELAFQWGQGYWGGAVPMTGGALALGALRRITESAGTRAGLWLGLGLAILANSRPYEGLILSLPILAVLLGWMVRQRRTNGRAAVLKTGLPVAGVLAATALLMGYYNFRVTGSPWRLPYQVHEATYGAAPLFVWQKLGPEPVYNHEAMRSFHVDWWRVTYRQHQSFGGLLSREADKLYILGQGYSWSLLLVFPFIALPRILRKDRWTRFALLTGILCVLALLPITWLYTHYAAPAAGLFFLLVVQSMQELRNWPWRGRPTGAFLVHGILVLCTLSFVLIVMRHATAPKDGWQFQRARLMEQLEQDHGKHLVIVRYQPGHNAHREWVYNAADIANARVTWAREMTTGRNRRLLDHFKDRHAWLLEADLPQPTLVPYPRPQVEVRRKAP